MATTLRKIRWSPALELLATRLNAMASSVLGFANIGGATAAGKLRTSAPVAYRVDGAIYSKPSTDDLWDLTAQTALGGAEFKAFRLYLDSAGVATIEGGSAAASSALALAALPRPSTSKAVIGVYVAGPSTHFGSALAGQGTIYHGTPTGTVGGIDLLTLSAPQLVALTSAQKATIRLYLGYADGSVGGAGSNLEGPMTGLSADAETLVVARLTSLASIETKLSSSWDRQKVVKAEEVTLAGEGELRALRSEGRRIVGQIAAILGVTPIVDVFSGAGAVSGPTSRG